MNRVLISNLADLHFAPTPHSRKNLLKEGIEEEKSTLPVILSWMLFSGFRENLPFQNEILLREIGEEENLKIITVTAHRRENWEAGIEEVAKALRTLEKDYQR